MTLRVSVALAMTGRQEVVDLELPEGATVAEAVAASGLLERFPGLDPATLSAGVWGRGRPAEARLRDGDRVEILRPLRADAKAQRRARAGLRPSSPRSRSGR
jgi:putative ubiquitin-RnfH superfamily antitoxin RatB of RatAB toxin-antitoxin module